jgi:two-component system sensor kinase FixL
MTDDRKSPAPSVTESGPQLGDSRMLQDRMMQVSRFATIGEMAAGVAHELNQPLTAISNYARACENFLRRTGEEQPDVRDALREIGREADRAAGIIRRLRDLVRGQPTERAAADLNELVAELEELIQSNARVYNVRMRFDLASPLPRVVVDRVQIQHVLLNLVGNALEALRSAAPAQREVVIQTQAAGAGEVELSVTDSGPGIAPQVAGRLFTPFVSTKPSGTGLGLVSSQTIVRAHDGTLGYRPNAPSGACFFMRLPARPE